MQGGHNKLNNRAGFRSVWLNRAPEMYGPRILKNKFSLDSWRHFPSTLSIAVEEIIT